MREKRVRRILEPILAGESPDPEVFDDDYQFVETLGLVALGESGLEIANPIYNEIIPRALTAVAERFVPMRRAAYVQEDGRLDWPALLDGFTAFWKRNAEWMLRQQPYSEAAAQMVFMAFLHRLVNGPELDPTGRIATVDREFAVGSGRVDLLVRWPLKGHETQHFAVELKVRRNKDGDTRAWCSSRTISIVSISTPEPWFSSTCAATPRPWLSAARGRPQSTPAARSLC